MMCTGRVDLSFLLRAFSRGADGVFIIGCHLNECNYITHGNFHALSTYHIFKKLLEQIGLNPERLRIKFMSGGEGNLFCDTMNDFGRTIQGLGPLGKGEGMDAHVLKAKLSAATKLTHYLRLVERERLRLPFTSKDDYQQFYDSEEVKKLFDDLLSDKLAVSEITSLLSEGPLSTADISGMLKMSPSEVARHMNSSSKQGLVRFDEEHKRYFLA